MINFHTADGIAVQKYKSHQHEDYATVARRLSNRCTKTMQLLHEDYATVAQRLCNCCMKTMQPLYEDYATVARRLCNSCTKTKQPLCSAANTKTAKQTLRFSWVRLPFSGSECHRFLSRAKLNIELHQYCPE